MQEQCEVPLINTDDLVKVSWRKFNVMVSFSDHIMFVQFNAHWECYSLPTQWHSAN